MTVGNDRRDGIVLQSVHVGGHLPEWILEEKVKEKHINKS